MHGRTIIKILRAIDLLAGPRGATVAQLEAELGISRRSVYRLFDTLDELGFPRYDEEVPGEREKRWRLQEDYLQKLPNLRIPDVRLNPREVMVLSLLLSADRVLAGTTVEAVIRSIRDKISSVMPGELLTAAQLDRLDSLFVAGPIHPAAYGNKEAVIEAAMDAIVERAECEVVYESLSDGRTRTYLVHPLRMFHHDGGLYLFVNIPKHQAIRILALDRITALTPTGSWFTEPASFNPEEILANTFDLTLDDPVEVTLRFTPAGARRVRGRRWAARQALTEHEDGGVLLRMTTSGSWDLLRWVLAFGGDAEVVEPAELRRMVHDASIAVRDAHTPRGTGAPSDE